MNRYIKNIGPTLAVLGLLDLVLNSDAYAEQIKQDAKMFKEDHCAGKDDWVYVDALSLRQDLNARALFSGDNREGFINTVADSNEPMLLPLLIDFRTNEPDLLVADRTIMAISKLAKKGPSHTWRKIDGNCLVGLLQRISSKQRSHNNSHY